MALHSASARWGMGLVMLFAFAGWAFPSRWCTRQWDTSPPACARLYLHVLQGISVGGLAKVTNECREKETTLFAATQLNSGHLQLFPNVDEDSAYNCGARQMMMHA
eukprot:390968-Pelagomonas_calceolata.AAC.3